MVRYECIDFFLLIVYGEVRMYRLSFVNKDDDYDDEALSKMLFKFPHILPTEHAQCQP